MIRNVLEYLERSAERFPDKIALEDEHEKLTYTEYITKDNYQGGGMGISVTYCDYKLAGGDGSGRVQR